MSRKFNEIDIKIFNKLAPELNGNIISNMGHQYSLDLLRYNNLIKILVSFTRPYIFNSLTFQMIVP